MPWNPSLPENHTYPSHLAVFDNTIGRLWRDETRVGYVSFSLEQAVTQTGGALWWRRFSAPYDIVWYMEWLYPDTPDERVDEGPLSAPTAGDVEPEKWPVSPWHVNTDPHASEDFLEKAPVILRVEFLTGDERDTAWERYGQGDE